MVDEQKQRLVQSRRYCTERIAEVKNEISRYQTESGELRNKLDSVEKSDGDSVRRRRRYLSRRLEELKAELTSLTSELQDSTNKLTGFPAVPGEARH